MFESEPALELLSNGVTRRTFARILAAGAAVAAIRPVTAAPSPARRVVRLSANENPFGPAPSAVEAMTRAIARAPRYPDELQDELVADLAALHGLSTSEILPGHGSSDILRVSVAAFTGPRRPLVTANPTFEAPSKAARVGGAEVVLVPLDGSFAHDVPKMLEAASEAGLVYVCNPNNPTATTTPKASLRTLIERLSPSTYVLVDEAYHHYATSGDYESVIPLVRSHPNLVVARTFSKIYAMAGMRCGYAVAQKETIRKLAAQQQWDPLNVVALAGARASVADQRHVPAAREQNLQTKRWLSTELSQLGYSHLPSEANFMMIDLKREVKPVIASMRDSGVYAGRLFPAMPKHLRITIGTPEEMEAFVAALKPALL